MSRTGAGDEDDESEWDEYVRELSIHLLRLFWIQAWSQLDSLDQEIELLHNAPPSPENRPHAVTERDTDAWRLDAPPPRNMVDDRGPLLDQSGKVASRPISPGSFLTCALAPEAVHDTPWRCNR